MAKPFVRVQRFLRWTPILFVFLIVAYLMAGSLLLLQRSGFSIQLGPRGVSNSQPTSATTILDKAISDPETAYSLKYKSKMPVSMQVWDEPVMNRKFGPRWLISGHPEIGHLRRRWFNSFVKEQEPRQRLEIGTVKKTTGSKATHIGCFRDESKEKALKGAVFYDFRKMTVSQCQDSCAERGYLYAGLEYGAECYCGNRITTSSARQEDCNMECKGEKHTVCGGVNRLSVYKVEDLRPSNKRYRNVLYRGCFKIPKNLTATFPVYSIQPNLTVAKCTEFCTKKEFPLIVIRRIECYCGFATTDFTLHDIANDQLCGKLSSDTTTEFLGDENYCVIYQTPVQDTRCTDRKFLPTKTKVMVALSSFPGAGNTWARHLIEHATGFYTGSYYFDGTLYNKGFKGEKDYWKSGRTICIKTHESGKREIETFDAAILLIRNPYKALMAEFNRKRAGHLGYASERHWKSKEWPEFVNTYAPWWASHTLDWLKYCSRVLVVHYEDLKKNLLPQLKRMVEFLNISVSDDRLLCVETQKDGNFKRSGLRQKDFDPFTLEMKSVINSYIEMVDEALKMKNLTGLPEEYLPR
ncbi:WSC domain-containing protein 1-like isoform X1 [Chiloscyllium plagiosum]|uniref:WSC domain-containing protein 1-like isoform X1 n=1 Tax=Chiloscyllium plagiosum TaxID=36176 RepID=UPI001CB84FE2|nr:WSC domain-containing protein 1-like isoform X1 [Chiloscyllium plagiosum]XP_043574425.1 WSC domain-containing protein 1-like isoform X1 [Chiloscyllium plagiosum]XP_043574427.1 WSC domain-containing protein 1-like isoform X1 [Chiloscyllium plagiosum]XP_043574428.1 WSC domain-containing protein 1-like isoform X1 [Chiloscyllium plagiosum]XP_043574429.1 WSC domain-containing protein 1-like isoform X1 [Chiloscyllium plagiosum]XP_043574430.1 WSC domain-containing protein 1-like isoform X1 [Chilos